MSFGKAKIKRFNEINAPLLTLHSLKLNGKEDILKKKKIPKSDHSSETVSVKSTPCFKTPALFTKKKPSAVPNKCESSCIGREQLELDALRDKIVECENKDSTIKDLREQIEELKAAINIVESNKAQLTSERATYEESIFRQRTDHFLVLYKTMEEFEQSTIAFSLKEKTMLSDIDLLNKEINTLNEEHRENVKKLKNDCDQIQHACQQLVKELNEVIDEKNSELSKKEQELRSSQKEYVRLQREYCIEVEKLKKAHQLEIQNIEFEFLKTMTELQNEKDMLLRKTNDMEAAEEKKIEDIHSRFELKESEIIREYEKKLREVEQTMFVEHQQDLKLKIMELEEIHRKQLELQQKESDAILKECQTISEFNIIQSEVEKNKIKCELQKITENYLSLQKIYDDQLKNYSTLKGRYTVLENDLNRLLVQLKDTQETLTQELIKKEKALETMAKEKASYEVSFKTYQTTIEVLKKRLRNSDNDVEQLKAELSKCEERVLEYETKYLQLSSDLKQAQMTNEELEMQFESTVKLNRIEIEKMREDLCQKVDLYRHIVQKEKDEKKEIMQQLHEAFDITQKLKKENERIESINKQYEFEIRREQNELDGYHLKEIDWSIKCESYEDTVRQVENELERKSNKINELQMEIKNIKQSERCSQHVHLSDEDEQNIYSKYIQISGRYDEILQKYENLQKEYTKKDEMLKKLITDPNENTTVQKITTEHEMKLEKTDTDITANNSLSKLEEHDLLLKKLQHTENELREVSKKYADLVGHHNSKQKIKHISDLKHKNEELAQQNLELSHKVASQKKTMDKLKKENADLKKCLKKQKHFKEDKENVGSPVRSLNSSRIESPLRDRN